MRLPPLHLLATPALITATLPSHAFDVNDQLPIGGILAPTGQCRSVSALLPSESYGEALLDDAGEPLLDPVSGEPLLDDSMDPFDDERRNGMPLHRHVGCQPNNCNELFFRLGFAMDNGLNTVSPWILALWAADPEDDVEDINGRSHDCLLTAWCKHTQVFQYESTLGTSIGIIDYIDGNERANDELSEFTNEVFVRSGIYSLALYDAGAAHEFASGNWTLTGRGMNAGENDNGENHNFWGAEVGYHPETAMGTGGCGLTVSGTSSKFLDPTGEKDEGLLSYGLSFDQAFGEVVGGFLRLTWPEEDAAIDHKALYSGGLNSSGAGWNDAKEINKELLLGRDGRTLIVANGGLLTHPDSGRIKLNLDSMSPSLVHRGAETGDGSGLAPGSSSGKLLLSSGTGERWRHPVAEGDKQALESAPAGFRWDNHLFRV